MDKCIIIMGMHKGGTSVTANIVDELGFDLGRDSYIPPDDINTHGYFENKAITDMNNAVMKSQGYSWWDIDRYLSPNPELVDIEIFKKDMWGWKDPRTTFTMESFLPHLGECDIKMIFVKRNKESNIKSLMKTHKRQIEGRKVTKKVFADMYDIYWEMNELNMQSYDSIIVEFDNYFISPKSEAKKISDFLGVDKDASYVIDRRSKHF